MTENQESLLLELSQTSDIDSGNLVHASESVLRTASTGLGTQRASIWLSAIDQIQCQMLFADGDIVSEIDISLTRKDFPAYFAALETERAIVASNAEIHPATYEFTECYLRPLGIKSMLDFPIRHNGKMIGVICCEYQGETGKAWSNGDVAFITVLAEMYGRAVNASSRQSFEEQLMMINQSLERIVEERTEELEQSLKALATAQSKLVETERFVTFGKLIQGISHELNTPLGVILTGLSHSHEKLHFVSEQIDAGSLTKNVLVSEINELKTTTILCERNAIRVAKLIEDFKQVAVLTESDSPQAFQLTGFLKQVIETLQPIVKKHEINIELKCEANVTITSWQGLLAQVLGTLMDNAIQHAFNDQVESRDIQIVAKTTKDGLILRFSDNGSGIENIHRDKIFEPFYTTKRQFGATGLGLSLVFNIVHHKLNGELSLCNEHKKGSAFILRLPYSVIPC